MSKAYTAQAVVQRMIDAAKADDALNTAYLTAEDAFQASAIYTAKALLAGTTAKDIALAASEAASTDPSLKVHAKAGEGQLLYTSPASVGHHARTGQVLNLAGDLPEFVSARMVQGWITKLRTGLVDQIIAQETTREGAAKKLKSEAGKVDAAKKAKARAAKEAAKATEAPIQSVETPVSHLQAALSSVQAAVESDDWDQDTWDAASAIVSALGAVWPTEDVAAA